MLMETPENLLLLKGIFLLVLTVHLAFASALTGGTLVSLVFAFFGRQDLVPNYLRLARKLAEVVTLKKSVTITLCLSLLVALAAAELIYSPEVFSTPVWGALVGVLFFGLALIYFYRHRLLREKSPSAATLVWGAAGLLLVLGVYFLLCSGGALLQMPHTWPHLSGKPQLALSWTGVANFLEFLFLGLGITGIGMRLFAGLSLDKDGEDTDYLSAVRKWGTSLGLTVMILLPPLILFDLINLPRFALSVPLFAVTLVALALPALLAMSLVQTGEERSRRPVKLLMSGALGTLLFLVLMGHTVREQTLADEALPLRQETSRAEEEPSDASRPMVQKGEEVFDGRCTSCHAFDRRLVGPPLNEVLPKYRDDEEALKDFIRNPVKKNPDYPSMPALELSDQDIEAVTSFLMNKLES